MTTTKNRLSATQIELNQIAGSKMIQQLESLKFSTTQYTGDKIQDDRIINQVMSANGQLEAYCLIFLGKISKAIDIEKKIRQINFKGQVRAWKNTKRKIQAGILDASNVAFEELKSRIIIENNQLISLIVGMISKVHTFQIAA